VHVLAERDHTTFRQIVWIEDHLAVSSPISRPPDNGASEQERLSRRRPALALEARHRGGCRGGPCGADRDEFLRPQRRFPPSRPRTWSQVVVADELPDCKALLNVGEKMECLERSIAILQKVATRNAVQMGSKTFGQNQSDSPKWSLQLLAGAGPASWTSPPIAFPQQFATKPAVFVAIAGIESGANADTDLFGFSAEATDITETGFRVTFRRTQGALYGVTVNWFAFGADKP
jgi:hypothetical protein